MGIARANAKEELVRLNSVLNSPCLLIGGLAVQQYVISRISKDIDLICDFNTVQRILEELYPTKDWVTKDLLSDDYRPSYCINHRHLKSPEIVFGPKISERGGYEFLDWDALGKDARPFVHRGQRLANISVPPPHALAYSKMVSFVGRHKCNEEKIKQDLRDFTNLTNHIEFNLASFWDLIQQYDQNGTLVEGFRERNRHYPDIVRESCLHALTELFSGPRYVTLEQLGCFEGSAPNLVRVLVVANRIEQPEGSLRKAVEDNFAKNVEYLFLISSSTAASEQKGYYQIFQAYQKIKNPNADLLDIKALPFEWDDYPIIFYQFKQNDDKLASVAYRGSHLRKGITKFYELVPAEYAHTIAKSLLADAPTDIKQDEIPDREQFESGKGLGFNVNGCKE